MALRTYETQRMAICYFIDHYLVYVFFFTKLVPLYVLTVTCHFLIVTCTITTLNEIVLNVFLGDWWINRVRKITEPAIY